MIPQNPYALDLGLPEKACVENVMALLAMPSCENPQAKAAGKCWLTYRVCEGKLDFGVWERDVLPNEYTVEYNEHLTARWAMSQATATCYAYFLKGTHEQGAEKARVAMDLWREVGDLWGPSSNNFVRVACLYAYHGLLTGKGDTWVIEQVDDSLGAWQRSFGQLDWRAFNLQYTEMRDAIVAAQMLVFVAGSAGEPIARMPWCDPVKNLIPTSRWSPFYEICERMAQKVNPSIIWTPTQRP